MPAIAQSRGCTAPEKEKDTQQKLVTFNDCWVNLQLHVCPLTATTCSKIVYTASHCDLIAWYYSGVKCNGYNINTKLCIICNYSLRCFLNTWGGYHRLPELIQMTWSGWLIIHCIVVKHKYRMQVLWENLTSQHGGCGDTRKGTETILKCQM